MSVCVSTVSTFICQCFFLTVLTSPSLLTDEDVPAFVADFMKGTPVFFSLFFFYFPQLLYLPPLLANVNTVVSLPKLTFP